ncbi:MAG: hypothetical protein HN742_07695 [Lentisphaerae bacterium]|jgi:UDP-N-acetylmuramate--alanine ligase|nr:hypothetical protein [Lentisphaerota bacterium]MBT4815402.1 hypothetical protein [Lentisphaerota bacterium]MBT5606187.1 hypothetical protein [Lentisphaerota bacterium]MBT7057867.1 hypothetical protein [Lentisphaerota bacterium]MBT7841739.1 hypothetical protein [Lentisphaerota bacterium]
MPHSQQTSYLPAPPATIFLIGVGGIGMSGLAQLLAHLGYRVMGSDRDADGPGRTVLMTQLKNIGISICEQDGEELRKQRPDAVIYSSAVESDNPDRKAASDLAIPEVPRAQALNDALNQVGGSQIAIAGSCGKTSVTGWVASALRELGQPVLMVCGGFAREFESGVLPGNFFSDEAPSWLVYEVDESDRSLTAFTPDYGMVLNIGTDHHERHELVQLFDAFLANCRVGAVTNANLATELASLSLTHQVCFADRVSSSHTTPVPGTVTPTGYTSAAEGITVSIADIGQIPTRQFGPHSAANAAAVLALLNILPGLPAQRTLAAALSAFRGVRQRFEVIGQAASGGWIYNDYAHNVEKIAAAVQTAQELGLGPVRILFQPHGYGPLGFMRDAFREALPDILGPGDDLVLLPVYYAGGTTSFSPTSAEVAADYAAAGLPVSAAPTREAAEASLFSSPGNDGVVLVLGARDPSLPVWCHELLAIGDG